MERSENKTKRSKKKIGITLAIKFYSVLIVIWVFFSFLNYDTELFFLRKLVGYALECDYIMMCGGYWIVYIVNHIHSVRWWHGSSMNQRVLKEFHDIR
jgi:hypothetical protein